MPEGGPTRPRSSWLLVRDLCLMVRLGVGEEERSEPQRLLVSLEVGVRPALPRDDDVTSVVDYGVLVAEIRKLASRETQLLETWALWIAEICLSDERVDSAIITLVKPDIFDGSVQVGIRQTIAR